MRILLSLLVCLACGFAQAKEYQFGLDVPGGHFSYFKFDEIPVVGSLNGTAKFLELRDGTKWLPLFSVTVEAADGRKLTQQFIAIKGGKTIIVKLFLDNVVVSETSFDVDKNSPLPVAISWTQAGEYSLSMPDGAVRTLDFVKPAHVRVSVSSADVEGKNWVVKAAQL